MKVGDRVRVLKEVMSFSRTFEAGTVCVIGNMYSDQVYIQRNAYSSGGVWTSMTKVEVVDKKCMFK